MDEEPEEDLSVKSGTIIESSKTKYTVIKLLGEGGFATVYKVQDMKEKNKFYAMKIEKKKDLRTSDSKLKMEIAILKLVSSIKRDIPHFTEIFDRARKDSFCFIVMQLVGKSLQDLKASQTLRCFSISTALGVSNQCLEAIEDLHRFGYIHRDLKPSNYTCGLAEKKHCIYLLDFGIARKILNDKGELKTPRSYVRFKGTVKFASLAVHKCQEQGYKDDAEAWLYLLLDLGVKEGLPWRRLQDKADVMRCKEDCRKDKREFLWGTLKCKEELSRLLDYFDSLKYHDHIDYTFVYRMIADAATTVGCNMEDPYDWEREVQTMTK